MTPRLADSRLARAVDAAPGPCLLVAGCCSAPRGASAHFVWAETDPAGKNAARLCFGEYPTLREGSPLLEKVARVRAYAGGREGPPRVEDGARETFFRVAGMDGAPVVVADLDLRRAGAPNTPPFFLRYEAQLLLGDGKPLSPEHLSTLSALKSELPLSVSLKPAGPDAVELTALLKRQAHGGGSLAPGTERNGGTGSGEIEGR